MPGHEPKGGTEPSPGSPEAHALGCICSPNQNRNGTGMNRPVFGVLFVALWWCPMHGVERWLRPCGGAKAKLR